MKLSVYTHSGDLSRYAAIAQAGFRHVDLSFQNFSLTAPAAMDYMTDDWRAVARKHASDLSAAGLTASQAHAPYCYPLPDEAAPALTAAIARAIDCCSEMNIPYLVVHPHAAQGMSCDEFLSVNVSRFRELIPAMERAGVKVLIENIGQIRDPHFTRNGAELRRLIEACDHPLFAACWDVGHAHHLTDDQTDSIHALGDLLLATHVHDNLGDLLPPRDKMWLVDMHTLPLQGSVDFAKVIRALQAIGYRGTFNLETVAPRTPASPSPLDDALPAIQAASLRYQYDLTKLLLQAFDCFDA